MQFILKYYIPERFENPEYYTPSIGNFIAFLFSNHAI